MSHHFDTKLAKDDPSLNLCDLYLFGGKPDTTVMAITVNPDVGLSTPDILHPEGLYAIRFDLNGDAREVVVFKFRFDAPRHARDSDERHIQHFVVRGASGETIRGDGGDLLIEGETGCVQESSDIRAYVGTVPELFAGDASALHSFLSAFYNDHKYYGEAFLNGKDFFARRNVTAMVVEIPNRLIGTGKVHCWATISLFGHAPEVQVQRWGFPLLTHLFLSASDELKEKFNTSPPADDVGLFSRPIAEFVQQLATHAQSATDPVEYGKEVAARLCPAMLPYEVGTQAVFDQSVFNGRPLGADVMDVMLSLASNKPLTDGVIGDRTRIRTTFPYFGDPYTEVEQAGVAPVPRPSEK
jgi:hypothetical protein